VNKKIIALAILFTIITSVAVFFYLENYKKSIDYREYAQVVIANRTIPNRSKITRDMLGMVTKDSAYVHPNAYRDIDAVAGSIATSRIAKGDEVLKDYIAAPGDIEKGLAFVVPDNMRAITIPVNEVSALNYMVRPGDMVDVIVTISLQEELPDGSTKSYNQSNYVLQKVFVLATNSNLGYDSGFVNQEGGTSGKNTVTLAVYPEHALPLALACDYGTIRLLLRSPADERETSVKPSLLEHFIRKDDTK
jgi:pilus assembly protein CpaB